ncbi:nuclear transport factor 2 family protein [Chitinophaga lutea]|nr:nuclear transport factor 2 family protein [Chitinophaga lutea]
METRLMIEAVLDIFIGADERDWDRCLRAFAPTVHLDYTSMAGGQPADLPAAAIVDAWKGFLPRFKATHHQLGNFTVSVKGEEAIVFFYGTATHYFPAGTGGNVWTVVGTYDAKLIQQDGRWKVSMLRLNLKYQDGNLALPELAGAAAS